MLQKMENNYNRIFDYWWIYLIVICVVGLIIRLYFLPWNIPYFTTMQGAQAAVFGIEAMKKTAMTVKSLQEYHHSNC